MGPSSSKPFNTDGCQKFLADSSSNQTYLLAGSSADFVRLSYDSCLQACGDETGKFDNIMPRINTWLIPVLLLLASAQFPAAAGSNQLREKLWRKAVVGLETLAHIIGDPVDYTFTLLSQLETWKECLDLARRLRPDRAQVQDVAIILTAFERVLDHLRERENAAHHFAAIARTLRNPEREMTAERWDAAIRYEAKIAHNFVVVRTRNLAPAIFAIAFYAWQIVGAFVPAIGASATPSGGRVAAALALSWIVFMVLFSNTVGQVASRTAYANTIKNYLKRRPFNFGAQEIPTGSLEFDRAIEDCLGTTYYTGYCYSLVREDASENAVNGPELRVRQQQIILHERHSPRLLRAIAHTPMLVAVGSSLAVTSLPPTYFSVRHFHFSGIGIMYHIISPALTSCLRRRWGLRAVRWKNAVIAVFMIGLFIVNSCGLFFNNCRGWTTIFPQGQGVVIYSKRDYDRNNAIWFPIITSICLSAQISLCVLISQYSRGLTIMKLAESS